jgi:hypothetical protein
MRPSLRGLLSVAFVCAALAFATTVSLTSAATNAVPPRSASLRLPASERTAQCPPVKGPRWVFPAAVHDSSDLYESYTISYTCAKAASYIERLAGKELADKTSGAENRLVGGPRGFLCVAYPDRNGHAYDGSCRRGAVAFGWNWNVAYEAITITPRGKKQTSTTDDSEVLRSLGNGKYQLVVGNTSGIGLINSFRWTPPAGLTITAVTKVSGGRCELSKDGSISCSGRLQRPTCLCGDAGGVLRVAFTGSGLKPTEVDGHKVYQALLEGHLRITRMTPVATTVVATSG